MVVQIQMRRDTAANWTSADPTLAEGELGLETDTGLFKFGDGATVWTSLGYVSNAAGIPAGGTTGQRLAKLSNTDYDVDWVSPGAATVDLAGDTGSATDIGDVTFVGAGGVAVDVNDLGGGAAEVTIDGSGIGGGSSALTLLASSVLGSAATDITLTGLSGSYKDLVVVAKLRGAASSDIQVTRMRLGSGSIDTGSNYGYYRTYAGSLAAGNVGSVADAFADCGSMTAATSPSGAFGFMRLEIVGYTSATHHKGWIGQSWQVGNGSLRSEFGGTWKNTSAAIDQVRIFADSGNLDTGSGLWIYGRG